MYLIEDEPLVPTCETPQVDQIREVGERKPPQHDDFKLPIVDIIHDSVPNHITNEVFLDGIGQNLRNLKRQFRNLISIFIDANYDSVGGLMVDIKRTIQTTTRLKEVKVPISNDFTVYQ